MAVRGGGSVRLVIDEAPTDALRSTYARIAADELRHAEVARTLEMWTYERLGRTARQRVQHARAQAVARLGRGLRRSASPVLVRELGMPDGATTKRMFAAAREQLWTTTTG